MAQLEILNSIMESRDHLKNGVNLKNHTNRRTYLRKVLFVLLAMSIIFCGYNNKIVAQTIKNDSNKPYTQDKKNVISVDIAPALSGLLNSTIAGFDNTFGLGGIVQYERMINPIFSLGGRFSYVHFNAKREGYDFTGTELLNKAMNIDRSAIELYGRYYPFQKFFFIDGTVVYTLENAQFKDIYIKDDKFSYIASTFSIVPKTGWKFSFKRVNGFIFETSLGYSLGFGKVGNDKLDILWNFFKNGFDGLDFKYGHNGFLFTGGVKVATSFGYAF